MTHSFVIVEKDEQSNYHPIAVIDSDSFSIAIPTLRILVFEWTWLPSFRDEEQEKLRFVNPWAKIVDEMKEAT